MTQVTDADRKASASIDQPYTDVILAFARHREASTAALTAEIQRLREALTEVKRMIDKDYVYDAWRIADEALSNLPLSTATQGDCQ